MVSKKLVKIIPSLVVGGMYVSKVNEIIVCFSPIVPVCIYMYNYDADLMR